MAVPESFSRSRCDGEYPATLFLSFRLSAKTRLGRDSKIPTANIFFSCVVLIVDTPRMFASRTFVKDGLPFIDASQLYRIITHFLLPAFRTRFLNGRPYRIATLLQRRLFGVALGPNGNRSIHGGGGDGRQLRHIVKVIAVVTDVAVNAAVGVDFQCHATSWAKGPSHGAVYLSVLSSYMLFVLDGSKIVCLCSGWSLSGQEGW